MNIRPFIIFQLLASSLPLSADIIIQQSNITGEADYGTGQGQSFLLPAGETVAALQLHIGSAGNDGGSIFVRLWEATGSPGSSFGRASAQPVATGTLDRSNVSGTPDWFTIVFDQSYTNQGPTAAYLVFEIESLTSGSGGWNNYSYSNQEPYSGGHSAYWTGSQYTIRDGQDLAFRILDSAHDVSVKELVLVVDFITDKIYEVDPETGAQSVVSDDPRLQGPTEIVVSPSGRIFIANFYRDEILEYDDSDQTVSVFASAGYLNAPVGIDFDSNGNMIVANRDGDSLVAINLNTHKQKLLAQGNLLTDPCDVAVDGNGNFLVTNGSGHSVVKINASSGNQSTLSAGHLLPFPDDIIVLSDGRILVSDLSNGMIIQITPSNGSQQAVAFAGFLDSPNSLTESSDGSLIVADGEQPGIIRIDLEASPENAQTLISDGGLFVNPKGATVIYRQINGSPPTDILLSNSTFDEHQPSGTFIGTLSSVDPDANDQFTYEITDGAYGISLSGNSLVTYKEFDYETEGPTFSVTIETTDSEGLRFEKVFTVSIQNITSDDDDEDGLTESEEFAQGTNKLDADSDDDGAIDGLEVVKATDPTDGNDAPDWYLATFGLTENGEQFVPEGVTTPWKLAAGHGFTIALLADGTVTGWGRNDQGQTDIPVGLNSVVDISAFGYHVLALKADGTVVAWGSNTESQTDVPPELDNVVAIAAGAYHSLALKSDGTVVSWGYNNNNQGTTPDGLNPVVDIAAGESTSLALHVNGSVTAWGANDAGQVDVLPAHRSVLDIAGGYSSSNLLLADQTLSVLGYYSGDSTIDPPSGTTSLVDIKAGTFHNLGIHSDGTASAWGYNSHGQATVPGAMKNIVSIVGGKFHSVAISASSASYPKIDCPKLNTGTQGDSFFLDVSVKGLTAPVFSTSTLPAGLTLDAETGIISGIPSNPGLTLSRISAQSGSLRVSRIIAFSVQSIPFSDWLENYFLPSELGNPLIVGENADPDKDGRSNLEEFNSDTHPNSPVHASNLTIDVDSGNVRLHVRMRKETDQLIHTGEYSTDLSTWYPLSPYLELKSVDDHAASEVLEYEVSPDHDPGPKVFYRYSIVNQGEH